MAAASPFILLLLCFLQTVLSQQHQPSPPDAHGDVLDGPGPSPSPSPLSNGSLLEQLEAPIKELKVWLRDTELLIFNSCLREQQEASQQLHSFKVAASLRRWGEASNPPTAGPLSPGQEVNHRSNQDQELLHGCSPDQLIRRFLQRKMLALI